MKDALRFVVIGGGSSYTPEIAEGIIDRKLSGDLPVKTLYLVDIEEGRGPYKLKTVAALIRRMVEKKKADIQVIDTFDRRAALADADFVVTQFRVGQLEARIRDEKIPQSFGILGQETTGLGGFMKAQRTIPVILDICRDMEELCPNAWLINFTNPSGIITEAVLKNSPIKVIGLCNGPINTLAQLSKVLEVPENELTVRIGGLNHFFYVLKVMRGNEDLMPLITKAFQEKKLGQPGELPPLPWDDDVLAALGIMPSPYQRYYYLKDFMLDHVLQDAKLNGTRGENVLHIEKELFKLYEDVNLDIKPPQLAMRGGARYSLAAINLICSIYNNTGDIQNVDVRNNGTIADLPDDVSIECTCCIDSDGAHPLPIGKLPVHLRGMVQVVKAYEELAVEAGVTGDYYTALNAMLVHPLVRDGVVAKKALDACLEANKDYLPQYARHFV